MTCSGRCSMANITIIRKPKVGICCWPVSEPSRRGVLLCSSVISVLALGPLFRSYPTLAAALLFHKLPRRFSRGSNCAALSRSTARAVRETAIRIGFYSAESGRALLACLRMDCGSSIDVAGCSQDWCRDPAVTGTIPAQRTLENAKLQIRLGCDRRQAPPLP
jgi:hypothetical protein